MSSTAWLGEGGDGGGGRQTERQKQVETERTVGSAARQLPNGGHTQPHLGRLKKISISERSVWSHGVKLLGLCEQPGVDASSTTTT